MPIAKSQKAEIAYSVEGHTDKPPLVLIMGLGGSADEWGDGFLELLRPHYRVVRLHNRGIGASTNTCADFTMQDMARDVSAVMDHLGLSKAHVLGLSMGGMIAQQVAIDFPERVDGLILMSTHFGGPEVVQMTERAQPMFKRSAQGESLEAYFAFVFDTLTFPGFAERRPELSAQFVAGRLRHLVSAEIFANQLRALLASDRSEAVASLPHRTLVLHGEDDCLVPVGNGEKLAERIPGARLERLPRCGHLPPWECPQRVTEALQSFLLR